MDQWDVIIIGGGPAGSTCATHLVRAGLNVLVLDKRTFPRDKVCAGWITPAVVRDLELDTKEYVSGNSLSGATGAGRVFQPMHGFRVSWFDPAQSCEPATVQVNYDEPVSYGIRRCELDDYLLRRSGATLALGQSVESMRLEQGKWTINDQHVAPLLIGAGGHACPVARWISGQSDAPSQICVAQEIEFAPNAQDRRSCPVDPRVPELFFCSDLKGYAWLVGKGDYLNVGLGRQDRADLTQHTNRFVQRMREIGRLPMDLPRRLNGHAYILYGQGTRPLVTDHALLIGDAAGLAYPQSGEGIRTAVESALLAAKTIMQAQGDYSKNRLMDYARRIAAHMGPMQPQQAAPPSSSLVPESWRLWVARVLMQQPPFVRHVVLNRWFLHRQTPALVTTA